MTNLKHVGIYVRSLIRMTEFYRKTFSLHTICENNIQDDELIAEITGEENAFVKITKLITDRGKETGVGDMLELIEWSDEKEISSGSAAFDRVCRPGCTHICIGVDSIKQTVIKLEANGGCIKTDIKKFPNGNSCCFCTDPEGNWIELISRN